MLDKVKEIKKKIGDRLNYKRTYVTHLFNNVGTYIGSHKFECSPIFLECEMEDYYKEFFKRMIKDPGIEISKIGHEYTKLNTDDLISCKHWYSVYKLVVKDNFKDLKLHYKIYVLDLDKNK